MPIVRIFVLYKLKKVNRKIVEKLLAIYQTQEENTE